MTLSPDALVVLSHLPVEPAAKSVRDLPGDILKDRRLVMRGKINRFLAEIRTAWGRKAVYHVYHTDGAPQQKHRFGIGKPFAYRRMRMMQMHDIPEHLDRHAARVGV